MSDSNLHMLTNWANPSSEGQVDRNYENILVGEPDNKTIGPFIFCVDVVNDE